MLVSTVQVSSSQHEDGDCSDGASVGVAAGPHDHRLAPDQDAAELRDGGGAAVRLPLHLQGDPVLRVHQVTILETALCTDKIMIMLYLCRTDSYNSAAWCATAVDPGGNVVTNRCVIISSHTSPHHHPCLLARWGDCDPARCPVEAAGSCEAVGGPGLGQPCIFPFTVDGETHHQCKVPQLDHCIEDGFHSFYYNKCRLQLGKVKTGCSSILLWGFITVETCKVSTRANFITNTRKLLKLIIMKLCPV